MTLSGYFLAAILAPGVVYLMAQSNAMNLLVMGHDTATALGLPVKRTLVGLLTATSLMVSATVCHCGLIGFIGLVMPHLLRLFLGADHRILAPACLLAGGAYMIGCDILARTLPSQGEMPVGVMTALIGAPVFIVLLRRTSR